MNIGGKVREERLKQNLKQVELSQKASISNTYLSDIETRRTISSIKSVIKIADALWVDCKYFMDD